MNNETRQPITEDWLREVGFKYAMPDAKRPAIKHWILWFGTSELSGDELGIELATNFNKDDPFWFCWLRCDMAHRYHRFVHIRHLTWVDELTRLIEGVTGQDWDAANNLYGIMRSPEAAARLRKESERLDRRLAADGCPWDTTERDADLAKPSHDDRRRAVGGKRIMGGQECED